MVHDAGLARAYFPEAASLAKGSVDLDATPVASTSGVESGESAHGEAAAGVPAQEGATGPRSSGAESGSAVAAGTEDAGTGLRGPWWKEGTFQHSSLVSRTIVELAERLPTSGVGEASWRCLACAQTGRRCSIGILWSPSCHEAALGEQWQDTSASLCRSSRRASRVQHGALETRVSVPRGRRAEHAVHGAGLGGRGAGGRAGGAGHDSRKGASEGWGRTALAIQGRLSTSAIDSSDLGCALRTVRRGSPSALTRLQRAG